ncbi:MAG: hypothetical protein HYT13_02450 [Candidatus Liptonbacteria bacterium]|nr:hypothetical protein [Candidatus Liptonbacteria bacterium]
MEKNKQSGAIIIVLILLLAWAFFHKDKYDGLTAEEWFNKYDYVDAQYRSFRSCVEDFDSFDIQTQIDYGGVFYYCE